MAKDILARGGKFAQFAAGAPRRDDSVELMNVAPDGEYEGYVIPQVSERIEAATPDRYIPMFDQILLRRNEAVTKIGGIYVPDETISKDKPAEGTVLEVGFDVKHVKAGQTIVFGKYAGTEYPINGELLVFLREKEVIAIREA